MARPPSSASPGWKRWSARSTSSPRPPAPTSAPTTTIASAIIVVWLTPAMMLGMAIGSCTLSSSWRRVVPKDCAASTTCGVTWRMPRLVRRMAGGTA